MLAEQTLSTSIVDGYVLRDISVICSGCSLAFATTCLVCVPPVTEYDTIEADLHRVLPDPSLRAALIAVCPDCGYGGWTARLKRSTLNPEMLPEQVALEHSKKFAVVVKSARERGMDSLDVAYLALNGLYCARECGEEDQLWLELAAYEQSKGMNAEQLLPLTGQDHLIMAELWRQLKRFDQAMAEYELAGQDEDIPQELISHQKMITATGNFEITWLPPHLVRSLFPEVEAATASLRVGKNGRPVPPNITRQTGPKRLDEVVSGPPDRRRILSSAVPDEPVATSIQSPAANEPVEPQEAVVTQQTARPTSLPHAFSGESVSAAITAIANKVRAQIQPQTPAEIPPAESYKAFALAAQTPAKSEPSESIVQRSMEAASKSSSSDGETKPSLQIARAEEAPAPTVGALVDQQAAPAQPAVPADEQAPAKNTNANATHVPLTKVRHIIAVPQASSSVSLVQASPVVNVGVNVSISNAGLAQDGVTKGARKKTMGEMQQVSEPEPPVATFAAASPPDEEPPAPKRSRRARSGKKEADPQDRFPEIQITDEEAAQFGYGFQYGNYGNNDSDSSAPDPSSGEDYEDADDNYGQYPASASEDTVYAAAAAATTTTAAAGGSAATETQVEQDDSREPGDHSDAIARVEGFLSLTRLPSYQSWIRGYRK